ncbi:MAG TPA: heavy metal-associated domain-containing protein [bacterium]|nr:heavy metal-associated domain-containing protein [bacterium]
MASKRKSVQIKGMYGTCCEYRIEHGLQYVPGILDVSVRFPIHAAFINYDPELLNWKRMDRHLERLGYQRVETTATVTVPLDGYKNAVAPDKLRSFFDATPWIEEVQVASDNSSVSVSYDSRAWAPSDIVKLVSEEIVCSTQGGTTRNRMFVTDGN